MNGAYILSGVLHCATCGELLHGDTTDGLQYYKAKRRAPGAQRCSGCRRRVRADVIEPAVLAVIPMMADHPICQQLILDEREALRDGTVRTGERRKKIDTKIRDCEAQIERLVDALSIGGAAGAAIQQRMGHINDEIGRLQRERSRLAAGELGRAPAAECAAEATAFNDAFAKASCEERKLLVSHLVVRIDVDIPAGRVVVGFRRPPLLAV